MVLTVTNSARIGMINFLGKMGADAAIRDFKKYHKPDDTEFEVKYFGPSGDGNKGRPAGCELFFHQLDMNVDELQLVETYAAAIERRMKEKSNLLGAESDRMTTLLDFVTKMKLACDYTEYVTLSLKFSATFFFQFSDP